MATLPFVIEQGRWRPRLVLQGPWTPLVARQAARMGPFTLVLNSQRGFTGTDLSFLLDVPGLVGLDIVGLGPQRIRVIESLVTLRTLSLIELTREVTDFTQLTKLEVLSLGQWSTKRYSSAMACSGLRIVFIHGYSGADLADFSRLRQLECLHLMLSRIASCSGAGALPELVRLQLEGVPRMASLEALRDSTSIRDLLVRQARNLRSMSGLEGARGLRYLSLAECPNIQSLEPIDGLPSLEVVGLNRSCVADGDMSPLARLPSALHVAFNDKSHYSMKSSAFPKILDGPRANGAPLPLPWEIDQAPRT